MKNVLASAIAITLSAAAAASLKPAPTVRPNCYPAEIRILTTVDVRTEQGYDCQAFYEVLDSGEIYAMYCEDFLPDDHCLGLMCDNDTPDDLTDDFYVRVIQWYDD